MPFARYASMHHKFMVVDGQTTALGAYNWYYDATYLNDEDVTFVRDAAFAARFEGELAELCRRYAPAFDATKWPAVEVTLRATHPNTSWGDALLAIGEVDALGAWSPARALTLEGYPVWSGTVKLPAGARIAFKLATRKSDGTVAWEAGDNRLLTVATGVARQVVDLTHR